MLVRILDLIGNQHTWSNVATTAWCCFENSQTNNAFRCLGRRPCIKNFNGKARFHSQFPHHFPCQVVPQKKSEGLRLLLHLARGGAKGVLCRHPNSRARVIRTQRRKDRAAGVLGWPQLQCQDTARQLCCWVPLQGEGGGGRGDRPADWGQVGESAMGEQVRWSHNGHHHMQTLHLPCLGPTLPFTFSCSCLEVLWITSISVDFRPRHVRVKSWDKQLLPPMTDVQFHFFRECQGPKVRDKDCLIVENQMPKSCYVRQGSMGALSIASFLNSIFAVRFSPLSSKATIMSKRFVQRFFNNVVSMEHMVHPLRPCSSAGNMGNYRLQY